jgi:phosphoribosylformylglycinamidine cyclo-ligase
LTEKELRYKAAGVDIAEMTAALAGARELIRSTHTPQVLSDVGGFGGMFEAVFPGVSEPVLVASIDGVGTKTLLAETDEQLAGIGRDIVHHCVNDILAQGARPLFFLDYFGTAGLRREQLVSVIRGMAAACKGVGCALLGGETAEMPDVYAPGRLELCGAIVGVVEKALRLPRPDVAPGDLLVGLASDGLHTNGFTLARRALLETLRLDPDRTHPALGRSVREELLRPHRCYLGPVLPLLGEGSPVLGIAHITGGGLVDNVPRALPEGCIPEFDRDAWVEPPVFALLRTPGIPDDEMLHTFNLGIGLVLVVRRGAEAGVLQALEAAGEKAVVIGEVKQKS